MGLAFPHFCELWQEKKDSGKGEEKRYRRTKGTAVKEEEKGRKHDIFNANLLM